MKILYVHNDYARKSGEEIAAESLVALLQEHGHEVRFFRRSSAELKGLFGQIKGFFCGIANPFAARELAKTLDEYKPDLVQVQNLYPLLSPSIFKPLKQRKLPVVMRCPNYRLFCPNGLCYDYQAEQVCEACLGGHEWNCLKRNCEKNLFKSFGYTLRNIAARKTGRILSNVDMFIVQTEFQKQKFIEQGIVADKIGILPGIMPKMEIPDEWSAGENITFIGRVSAEKGIEEFLTAARQLPNYPFMVAGAYNGMEHLVETSPTNVKWLGFRSGKDLREVYLNSRIVVIPSRCYEGFPNVIVTGMMLKRPIITVSHGAPGSIITDDKNGMLFTPGDGDMLTEKIAELYPNINRCKVMGEAGSSEAEQKYTREIIWQTLEEIYQRAFSHNSKN